VDENLIGSQRKAGSHFCAEKWIAVAKSDWIKSVMQQA